MKEPIEIIHRPFGDRHPYDPSADERKPRLPFAHHSVEVGVLTRPIGAVKRVSITFWTDDDQEAKKIREAAFVDSHADDVAYTEDGHLSEAAARSGLIFGVESWSGKLPAFSPGTKVYYQLAAETGDGTVQSQIFAYTVRKEVPLYKVVNIFQGQDSLVFVLENPEEEMCGYLSFVAGVEDHLQITVGHGTYSPSDLLEPIQYKTAVDDTLTIMLRESTLLASLNPLRIQYFFQDHLTLKGIYAPQLIIGDEGVVESVLLSMDCPQDEAFYGFGERFNAIDQRGQVLDVRVYEQCKNHGLRTYIPMPLFVSSRGYGLHVQSLRNSNFDLARDDPSRWILEMELGDQKHITLDVLPGHPAQLLDIVCRLNALTGRPSLPPDWAFGLWMSANEWNTQRRVEEVVTQTLGKTVFVMQTSTSLPTGCGLILKAW
jgi:hypothetical protein